MDIEKKENIIDLPWMTRYDQFIKANFGKVAKALQDQVDAIMALQAVNPSMEGYIRVSGVADPALSYKAYKKPSTGGPSWHDIFYPCLVGTPLTGSEGQILHVLQKLGARKATAEDEGFTEGQAVWDDLEGNTHAIDGTEGDVMITNIATYYMISGKYDIDGVTFDVFLRSLAPFTYNDVDAEEQKPFGQSPDYCVAHNDNGVTRMHSVYNPAWNGSYTAQNSIVGAYSFDTDADTGEITETYDETATVLGGAGGLHTTNLALYTGEQYAMNLNPDTTKTVPFYNSTAHGAEILWGNIAAEGGTFDAHRASLMGSGFCSNDPATAAADWDESATGAKNGMRLVDKNNALKYYSLSTDAKSWTGKSGEFRIATMINEWRNPFHIMEAYRVLCHASRMNIPELTWFTFEGGKYKWRSIEGFNGPANGEATAVVFKQISSKLAANVVDPTDKTTSIEGNRIDFLVSVALYHGITTQVSPSWWTSGLIFTEDENGQYEAYMERDQDKLIKSENGDKNIDASFNFETLYAHVGTFAKGEGYRKNYSKDAFMLPDSNANKTGAGLHTYVGGYNWFTGTNAGAGKKSARGFRRGHGASSSSLSPLSMNAYVAPSIMYSNIAFGTCCRIVEIE